MSIINIKWCNFKSDFTDEFKSLLQTGELSDIRIGTVDQSKICLHKIILRNVSEYFRDVFNVNPKIRYIKLPIDAKAAKFAILLMYHGEVNIPKNFLGVFLKAARLLRLKGFKTVSERDLSTERDFEIDLSKQSDDFLEYTKKHKLDQNDSISPTEEPLRKKVKRSVTFDTDLATDEFVSPSNSISRTRTSDLCLKKTDDSIHMSFVDVSSGFSSNIDFIALQNTPSDDESAPEIVS